MADSFLSKINPFRKWRPTLWAGFIPNGMGQVKPNHYLDMVRVIWQNRDQLPFAWRILSRGVCDGCALGTSGLKDYTLEGVHLCTVRLQLLRLNTMPGLKVERLTDVSALRQKTSRELRELGRLPYPMVRRRGEPGFTRIPWEEALGIAAQAISRSRPDRLAFYLTSRGITNEVYYVAQKVARFLGTNNVDNSARLCHAPSTVALKEMLGVGASTCSYSDWLAADLIVFFGSNTPNTQPVTTKYLYYARQRGTRVAVVNPYREPGFKRYWVPSVMESALFGTKLTDEFFELDTGGDAAFLSGALKVLLEENEIDRNFVADRTSGFEELEKQIVATSWDELESASGASRETIQKFARMLISAENAVFVWSMGLTQHTHGVDNVRALVNLALARGYIGRKGNGVMPIRGHSGVQGGAEVGCVPGNLPGGAPVDGPDRERIEKLWGFEIPTAPGLAAGEMLHAAGAGNLDVLYSVGGNFLETLPDPTGVEEALGTVPLRIHQDIVVTSQMLVEPADTVLLLPARTRYEQRGGGTETSTERRILFSPEIRGRRVGESRGEWEILQEIAALVRPGDRERIIFADGDSVRAEISQAVPMYGGIEKLRVQGDQIQYGGTRLFEGSPFAKEDGRAHFSRVQWPDNKLEPDEFRVSTRRGRQFNSIVHADRDPLNGARRDSILIASSDAVRLQLREGSQVRLRSAWGEFTGRVMIVEIHPGNLQVHWPEGNTLLSPGVHEPLSGIPDYNARVRLEVVE